MSFDKYAIRVNEELTKYLAGSGDLQDIMSYSALDVGKRFRPVLMYVVANMFAVDLKLVDSSACALEFIHIYSLVHDDLPAMDDDKIRHGKPACHVKFGEAQGILAGDGLQSLAFNVLANDEIIDAKTKVKLIQELSRASLTMANGQLIDINIIAKKVDTDTLQNMYIKKTGALLKCAVNFGIIAAAMDNTKDGELLNKFIENIGLAYQIQDDVLDLTTSTAKIGKQQGSDAVKNKPTYASLLGVDSSQKKYKELYDNAQQILLELSVNADELLALTKKLQHRDF